MASRVYQRAVLSDPSADTVAGTDADMDEATRATAGGGGAAARDPRPGCALRMMESGTAVIILSHMTETAQGSVFEAELARAVRSRVALKAVHLRASRAGYMLARDTGGTGPVRRSATGDHELDGDRRTAERAEAEVEVLLMFRARGSRRVARIVDVGADDVWLFIVLEWAGTDIVSWASRHFGAEMLRMFARGLLCAVEEIHAAGVAHCDLSPHNIMVDHAGQLRLIDFGGARGAAEALLGPGSRVCGKAAYVAPEIIAWQCDRALRLDLGKVDVWGVGVCVLYLFAGETYRSPHASDRRWQAIREGRVDTLVPGGAAPAAVDFIRGCLHHDPAARLSVAQALKHPWVV